MPAKPINPAHVSDRIARAIAAAGTDPCRFGYDANGIHELIAASGRPISMRGASEAILAFDKEVSEGERPIFGSGGRHDADDNEEQDR